MQVQVFPDENKPPFRIIDLNNFENWNPHPTSSPSSDISNLQNKFHKMVIESFSLPRHNLLSIYFSYLSIDNDFKPLPSTINELSRRIRFNLLHSEIISYEFFLSIEDGFNNEKLSKALALFREIYASRIKEKEQDKEFNTWINDLIT